mgnify:FL=1
MNNEVGKIKELIKQLNKASDTYYNSSPTMSDYEWDKLLDELKYLEDETGIIYPNSPIQNVGYSVLDEITKVKHNHPMLSLDKTKSVDDLRKFASNNACVLSVKCDGLTTSLHYNNGKLISAETRGNGVEGSDVLNNALTIKNIPHEIPYMGDLIIDGEVIIGWDTFNSINEKLPEDQKYKHPRNLVSGSLTLLDSKEAANRNMRFIAWRVIKGFQHKSVLMDLVTAEKCGFESVPAFMYIDKADGERIDELVNKIQEMADNAGIPYDGAVMAVNNYELAESMGRTDKFYRHSIAYKYEDELYETVLRDIEWNTSKTGLVNPVAIFDPVDLDGAITTRATLHNVTYIKNMMLGIGDRIRIYRSNKVIPKVHDSIDKSGNFTIPSTCPICGGPTKIVKENDSEVLICDNSTCSGKLLGRLKHAVSRDALNIDGLSEATIQKFIDLGWLTSIKDIYHLSDYEKRITNLEGFGKKSATKLLKAIEDSRSTTFDRFLYSLSIPLCGGKASKMIAEAEDYQVENFFRDMTLYGAKFFNYLPGVADALVNNLDEYFKNNCDKILELSKEFNFEIPTKVDLTDNRLDGLTFVVTGKVTQYKSRDELKKEIESLGGKVAGSVSAKTTALINNDIESTSSKNKKAKELNVPILTENMFIEKYLK